MRKMGWREGEGLGKNKEGSVEPIMVDFKTDRKGESCLKNVLWLFTSPGCLEMAEALGSRRCFLEHEQVLGFHLRFAKAWGLSKALSLWRSCSGWCGESGWSRNRMGWKMEQWAQFHTGVRTEVRAPKLSFVSDSNSGIWGFPVDSVPFICPSFPCCSSPV